MSHVMRKPAFAYAKTKAQISCTVCAADQCLCFRYIDSTIPLVSKIRNFKPLAIFCDYTARFVSDLIGNPAGKCSRHDGKI